MLGTLILPLIFLRNRVEKKNAASDAQRGRAHQREQDRVADAQAR